MPLRDTICLKCNTIKEVLVKMNALPDTCECGTQKIFALPLIARTSARWGDSGTGAASNVNGTYDRGLGATYHNSMEREAIMKAKGLISLEDVGGDNFVSDRFASEIKIKAEQDAILESYHTKVADYGGTEQAQIKAIEELFPARECLDNVGNTATINANPWTGQTTYSEDI